MASTTSSVSKTTVPWWMILIEGIAAVILGLMLITSPGVTLLVMVQFLGMYWLIKGILDIVSLFIDRAMWGWKLLSGILGILAGIVILQHPLWSGVLIPGTIIIILAVQGIVMGIVGLISAFRGGGWGAGILGVLSIIFGIILLGNPIVTGIVALPIVLGVFGLAGGIASIVMSLQVRKLQ